MKTKAATAGRRAARTEAARPTGTPTVPATRLRRAGSCGVLAVTLLALAAVPAQSAPGASQAAAGSARTVTLNESANLHLTSKHGFTFNEQGEASGTTRGMLYVHLTIVSSSRVTAEINFYPSNGSISSRGSASYHRGRTNASFAGALSIVKASGAYAHAHGSGLGFSGTIQRSNDAISVHVSGRVTE
ncbi:MAG TPA: hypothetical protein VHU13_01185 [Solirubrobacteraceae bacterium]|nr:hypothetical protein [Solirubrobacteraceae bacterium]